MNNVVYLKEFDKVEQFMAFASLFETLRRLNICRMMFRIEHSNHPTRTRISCKIKELNAY